MVDPMYEIHHALEVLALPQMVTRSDIKKQYHFLAKQYHPDIAKESQKMEEINHAYALLMKYIEEFRYTFDDEEISKQFPGVNYAKQFNP